MKKFWIKFSLFLLFSLIIPISFLAIKFKLFSQIKTINVITIWTFIAIVILIVVVTCLIKIYLSGMKTRYSIFKQILEGVIKIIFPLIILTVLIVFARRILITNAQAMINGMKSLIQVLIVIIACESVAIVINPLPKWAFDNNVEGLAEIYEKVKGGEKQ